MLDQYQQCRDLSRYTSAPLASRRHLENFDDLEASEQSTPTPAAQTQTGAVTSKQEQLQPHPFSQNELSPSSRTIKEASPESNRSSRSINELLARGEPFYDSQEQHILIGVANIVLQSLFYNFEFDYEAPIISQQGEVRVLYTLYKYSYTTSIYSLQQTRNLSYNADCRQAQDSAESSAAQSAQVLCGEQQSCAPAAA